MNNKLKNIASVPVRSSVISSLYLEIKVKDMKIAALVQKGELIFLIIATVRRFSCSWQTW